MRFLLKMIYQLFIKMRDKKSNTFGSVNIDSGEIRTFYKPDINIHGYKTNLDYFDAQ